MADDDEDDYFGINQFDPVPKSVQYNSTFSEGSGKKYGGQNVSYDYEREREYRPIKRKNRDVEQIEEYHGELGKKGVNPWSKHDEYYDEIPDRPRRFSENTNDTVLQNQSARRSSEKFIDEQYFQYSTESQPTRVKQSGDYGYIDEQYFGNSQSTPHREASIKHEEGRNKLGRDSRSRSNRDRQSGQKQLQEEYGYVDEQYFGGTQPQQPSYQLRERSPQYPREKFSQEVDGRRKKEYKSKYSSRKSYQDDRLNDDGRLQESELGQFDEDADFIPEPEDYKYDPKTGRFVPPKHSMPIEISERPQAFTSAKTDTEPRENLRYFDESTRDPRTLPEVRQLSNRNKGKPKQENDVNSALASVRRPTHTWWSDDGEDGLTDDFSEEQLQQEDAELDRMVSYTKRKHRPTVLEELENEPFDDTDTPKMAVDFARHLRNQRKEVDVEALAKKDIDGSLRSLHRIWSNIPPVNEMTEDELVQLLLGRVLYHENGLIALNKPYGLHAVAGANVSVHIEMLLPKLKDILAPKSESLYHLNRLDKDTTGVCLFATNKMLMTEVLDMWKKRLLIKKYWCLTKGVPDPKEAVIDIPLMLKNVGRGEKMVPVPDESNRNIGNNWQVQQFSRKKAVTEYSVLSEGLRCALVECTTRTGVRHQVRSHLGFGVSCPILGDHKYSDYSSLLPQRLPFEILKFLGIRSQKSRHLPMYLHSREIQVPEILEGRNLVIQAPVPQFFRFTMKKMKLFFFK